MNLQRELVISGSEFAPPQLEDLTGCSSVEHIFLDQFVDVYDEPDQEYTAESVLEFLLIPKKLRTLTVRGGLKRQLSTALGNQALYVLMLHLSKSLESVIEYNCRLRPAESTWGWFGRTNPVRNLYNGTTNVMINAIHVMIPAFPRLIQRQEERDEWKDPQMPRTLHNRRSSHIMPKAEVILVQKSYRDEEIMDAEVMERLEFQLYRLVENNARSGGKLKAIYIQQQPNPNKENKIAEFDYSKLINLGRERDIDIHVKENKNTPFYRMDFPTPPGFQRPILLGQETGGEDGKRVFDPFMGYWTTT